MMHYYSNVMLLLLPLLPLLWLLLLMWFQNHLHSIPFSRQLTNIYIHKVSICAKRTEKKIIFSEWFSVFTLFFALTHTRTDTHSVYRIKKWIPSHKQRKNYVQKSKQILSIHEMERTYFFPPAILHRNRWKK